MLCLVLITVLLAIPQTIAIDEKFYARWETLPLVPHVSGLRIVNKPNPEPVALLGYTNAGESIVEPDTRCIVVVFGYWLQHIEYLTFTDSNCHTSEFKIPQSEFIIQTETRIELEMMFPDVEESWRMCVKQDGDYGELLLVEDMRTWISTSATVSEHIMPLYVQVAIMLFLLSLSALFSGLNLGLMSLSIQELQLIIKSGSKKERRYAEHILPVRKRGNYLLCTILIMNVVVNSSISILFEDLTTGWVAFLISSFGIVVCGEIVPQSICVKYGLAVGSSTIFLTRFFMWITTPLSWPISKILDVLLGEEVERYNRKRLIEILKMETKNENKEFAADLKIAVGAMEIANKQVSDVMTRIDDAFMISEADILDETTVAHILKKGYTRIPVHEANDRNKIVSLLFVKDLALVNVKHNTTVGSVAAYNKHVLRIVNETMPLHDLLEEFKKGDYHLAMVHRAEPPTEEESTAWLASKLEQFKNSDCTIAVVNRSIKPIEEVNSDEEDTDEDGQRSAEMIPLTRDLSKEFEPSNASVKSVSTNSNRTYELVGLITLEDIIEEILQSEIIDESDTIMDNTHRLRRRQSSRLSDILNGESRTSPLSLHQLHVVERWLKDTFPMFNETTMEPTALRKLIQTNIRRTYVHKKERDAPSRRSVHVVDEGSTCKRALLILEGNLEAYFPQSGISFKVGPWASFGTSVVTKIQGELISSNKALTLSYTPDFVLRATETCKFLQLPFVQIVHAYRVTQFIRTLPNRRDSASRPKSEELKCSMVTIPRETSNSVSVTVRKYSDAPTKSYGLSPKKSVAF